MNTILVNEVDKVKKDEILLKLDHESLDIQLRQTAAIIEQAEAQLKLLKAGASKEDINLAQEQVKFAKINLDQAETDMDRLDKLYETNTITRKQYEDAVTRYDQTMNQYNSAKENLLKINQCLIMQMIFLSGFSFPVENMPVAIQYITYIIPLKYNLIIIRDIVLKGIGFNDLWQECILLFGMGIFILVLSSMRIKKRLE
ncbi:MAG: ABC transporter permease [Ignavibacteria bacterium]|nr:ABC transporter permease [Ignavibacteria bacterium]